MAKRVTEILAAVARRAELGGELDKFRRDITILFSDLQGSTSYFEKYGDGAGLALVYHCNQLQRPIIETAGGRVVKTMGDGLMAAFVEPKAALQAAIAIQRAVTTWSANRPEEHQAFLRIGLNCGLGIVKSDDVFGDVVNVASRVQSSAGPAQIAVSAELHARVADSGEFRFTCAGQKSFKGKAGKQEVYLLEWAEAQEAKTSPSAAAVITLQHIKADGSTGQRIPFGNEGVCIGAGPADVEFPSDPALLPQHARFFLEGGRAWVEQADQKAVVYVSLMGVYALKNGSVIKFGQQLFRYQEAEGVMAAAAAAGQTLLQLESVLRAPAAGLVNLNNSGQVIPVRDTDITIGRSQGTCTFPADGYMSRVHARLYHRGIDVFLEDAGSRNGTFLQLTGRALLQPGCKVQFGGQLFQLVSESLRVLE